MSEISRKLPKMVNLNQCISLHFNCSNFYCIYQNVFYTSCIVSDLNSQSMIPRTERCITTAQNEFTTNEAGKVAETLPGVFYIPTSLNFVTAQRFMSDLPRSGHVIIDCSAISHMDATVWLFESFFAFV